MCCAWMPILAAGILTNGSHRISQENREVMRFPTYDPTDIDRLDRCYPVGCVYQSVVPTEPAVLFGFGTWVALGAGRVLVGVDAGDADFDAAEKTSGSKTVTLVEGEIPAHAHPVNDPGHSHLTQRYPTTTGPSSGFTFDTSMSGTLADNTLPTKVAATGITVDNTGGGQPHSNVQPSLAVFRWKRTA